MKKPNKCSDCGDVRIVGGRIQCMCGEKGVGDYSKEFNEDFVDVWNDFCAISLHPCSCTCIHVKCLHSDELCYFVQCESCGNSTAYYETVLDAQSVWNDNNPLIEEDIIVD